MSARSPRRAPQVAPLMVRRSLRRRRHGWLCAAVLLAALAVGAPAQAENAFAERSGQVFDLIFVRPLGVGKVAYGFVCFLPMALFAEIPVAGWNDDDGYNAVADVWHAFVVEPFHDTFLMPLGEFEAE